MSTGKRKNELSWGGARPGAGRPEGKSKEKICVSVHAKNWDAAIKRWRKKPSWLVDRLIMRYVETSGGILKAEAVK